MAFIILFCIVGVIGLLGVAVALFAPSQAQGEEPTKGIGMAVIIFCLLANIFLIGMFSVHRIENGHVALIKTFGAITGQRGDGHGGLILTAPWQNVQQANVQLQSMCPNGKPSSSDGSCADNYGTFSSESIDVFVNAKLNFHVDPENIQILYRTVGPDYISKLIQPRVSQVIKEETVKYKAVDIAPHREEIRKAVTARLVIELAARSIVADDFLLTQIDFNQDVKKAIDQKVIEAQNAEAAQARVAAAEAQARQVAATAQGAADKLRIEAKGQADANDLINKSLTPLLIQFQSIQKLSGTINTIIVPANSGFLLPPELFQAKP